MASEKITAMPDLAGGQVPTDLVTAVDLSALPASQNVKSTLNDLFATITKNITDRAVRFQAPGTAPAVSAASQGSIYHNGTAFLASSNGRRLRTGLHAGSSDSGACFCWSHNRRPRPFRHFARWL
jgi:hypothetical protein